MRSYSKGANRQQQYTKIRSPKKPNGTKTDRWKREARKVSIGECTTLSIDEYEDRRIAEQLAAL